MILLIASITVNFSSLPYQIELLGSMWLMMIFYRKEKMVLW
jgi:hypothetical protein